MSQAPVGRAPITLGAQTLGAFPKQARQAGLDVSRRGLVEVVVGSSPNHIEAVIRGWDPARTSLRVEGGLLTVFCSCAVFQRQLHLRALDHGCAHLWAMILEAERSGLVRRGDDDPGGRWESEIDRLRMTAHVEDTPWPPEKEIVYVLESSPDEEFTVSMCWHQRSPAGHWSALRGVPVRDLPRLPPGDCEIVAALPAASRSTGLRLVPDNASAVLIPLLCATGRAFSEGAPLRWEPEPWHFSLEVRAEKGYALAGVLHRGGETIPLEVPRSVGSRVVIHQDTASPLANPRDHEWIRALRLGPLRVPRAEQSGLLELVFSMPHVPRLRLPPELAVTEVQAEPRPELEVRKHAQSDRNLRADAFFEYGGTRCPASGPSHVFDAGKRVLLRRDPGAEAARVGQLLLAGFRRAPHLEDHLVIAAKRLPRAVTALTAAGWLVKAEGKLYRAPGTFSLKVSSGLDWFDLHGKLEFGEESVPLPRLLQALKRRESMIVLDDGTMGMLPEEWVRKHAKLARAGRAEGDAIRFGRNQVALLDALLAEQPETQWDAQSHSLRTQIRSFSGVSPIDAPASFVGTLRGYQREGLGWLHFLNEFELGGCLADDMGLGKTIQVLALLADRHPTSLVVAPRSLVFNWQQEARRFAPHLKVLDFTGPERPRDLATLREANLVLTTYGVLLRDAVFLKDLRFDYAILDEAHTIKNADTASAKAARLLQADHRLVLTGTPVQNRMDDLWSLFEFLNPGMLGAASVFSGAVRGGDDSAQRDLWARALRPFLLRRTKEKVARDLPEKQEETLYCELEPEQRALYDELRNHYRRRLHEALEAGTMAESAFLILEALLRLRQAACHSGLIDAKRRGDPSAKLDLLLPQLEEVRAEGHKALVFSQFTSLLALVRTRLDKSGVVYEYLDGKTRDRKAPVERFQGDPDCGLFLISLKAGGVGLNLTAADYVFLLDPWWNPAIEAQAIDRAHRIGQTRPVFAYRIIAKDTVEERVVELQKQKRELADAIIGEEASLLKGLERGDLELLLS